MTIQERTKGLAARLLATLKDPNAEREREEYEEAKDKEDQAKILEYHLSKQLVAPTVADNFPKLYLAGVDAIRAYLGDRGVKHDNHPLGVTVYFSLGASSDFAVDVRWLADEGQVRFVAPSQIDPPDDKLAKLAWAIERVNHQIGFPVWRLEPDFAATFTVFTNHDGTISSRVFEHALAQLRQCLLRDLPTFRMVLRS
jgi:hypothetical protein